MCLFVCDFEWSSTWGTLYAFYYVFLLLHVPHNSSPLLSYPIYAPYILYIYMYMYIYIQGQHDMAIQLTESLVQHAEDQRAIILTQLGVSCCVCGVCHAQRVDCIDCPWY